MTCPLIAVRALVSVFASVTSVGRIPELHTGILEAILSESGPEVCLQFDLVGGPQAGLAFHFLEKVSNAIVLLVHRFPYLQ